ncbi:hypothetical protein J6590_022743 [Homalodisca vitripennis]|nr:hypothetical protein J6590_022743 [Homalodisca vitripennis]
MPRGECSALPRTVDTGVARYEAFASHNSNAQRCLAPSCASSGYLRCLPRTVQDTILHCKPTNLPNETVIMDNHEIIRQTFTLLAEELTLRQMARGIGNEQPRTVDTGLYAVTGYSGCVRGGQLCASLCSQSGQS